VQPTIATNTLFYGDNLPILREYIPDESIDLVYLDPPFNSNRNYSVLFRDESGKHSEAQIEAFEDTWHWSEHAEATFRNLVTESSAEVGQAIKALRELIGTNQVMAYLVMMAARLVELHRVLKPTGSLYLHCDPTASHYLKVLMDAIFGPTNFRNEIVWRRTPSKGLSSRRLARNHDVILGYQISDEATWNNDAAFTAYDPDNLDEKTAGKYTHRDEAGRLYRLDNLINPNPDRPNLTYEFLGVTRVWRWTRERMQAAYEAGLVIQTRPGAVPQLKRYLDEQRGRPLGDVWSDIEPLNSQARERLGYPTQKPEILLERIIRLATNEGDVVLDPFCGCGTTIVAAQKLRRHWVGIDITHLSVALMKYRLQDMFPGIEIRVVGEPEDLGGARQLAQDGRYQFQWWALSLIRAKPLGANKAGGKTGKKGADQGIDGVINFFDGDNTPKRVLVQVKSGKVSSRDIRDLVGTLDREKAQIGVFLTLEEPSGPMKKEAVSAGYYRSQGWGRDFPRMQILTVEQLLHGARVEMPPQHGTFREAQRARAQEPDHLRLDL
jgi:site-specific DNA-methyltransferase (adenine-specific)